VRNKWFVVDKEGLAKILHRRGKASLLFELFQNAWDEAVTVVRMQLTPVEGRPFARLVVEDDAPEGFKDLSHAFTLFAESEKKSDPSRRGRFNLGEKLVLACCESATITTTTGTIAFEADGSRRRSGKTTHVGSVFDGLVRMTRAELDEACREVRALIPPSEIQTFFNGVPLPRRAAIAEINATLPTEVADEEGRLRRTSRATVIRLYEPLEGEVAAAYEMGIPVVETGDKYHVDVAQKVPVTLDRDNLPPSYLQLLRTLVLNQMHERLTPQDATEQWVRQASGDDRCSDEAVNSVLTLRFGKNRVSYDPSDPEANKLAVSQGFTVITGGALSGGEWKNARRSGSVVAAGQVTPSPKPYSPDGAPLNLIPEAEWTPGMQRVANLARQIAERVFRIPSLEVRIARETKWPVLATYGRGGPLTLNVGQLGMAFFDQYPANRADVLELLIHEFGHEDCGDHLDAKYHKALTTLGGKLVELAVTEPSLFGG
jgi:hypothetical protein